MSSHILCTMALNSTSRFDLATTYSFWLLRVMKFPSKKVQYSDVSDVEPMVLELKLLSIYNKKVMGECRAVRGGRSRFVVGPNPLRFWSRIWEESWKVVFGREVEVSPLRLDSGRLVYVAYWKVLKLVVERLMIKVGLLARWRKTGSLEWSVGWIRQEGSFYVLKERERENLNSHSYCWLLTIEKYIYKARLN